MSDYSNGKIYAIKCAETDDVYIGSTIQELPQRLNGHKNDYKKWKNDKARYMTSYEIVQYESAYIELLEAYSCNSNEELERKEGDYIRSMDCVNQKIAGRTKAEYYQDNKDAIKEYRKEYYEDNKEQILEYNKEYYEDNKEQLLKNNKEYHEKNKEQILERHREYYQKNKEQLLEKKKKEKYTCVCGSYIRKGDRGKHEKTKKHQTYINNLKDNADPRQLNDFFEQFKFKI